MYMGQFLNLKRLKVYLHGTIFKPYTFKGLSTWDKPAELAGLEFKNPGPKTPPGANKGGPPPVRPGKWEYYTISAYLPGMTADSFFALKGTVSTV
jgi:hypothetical protein